MTKRSIASSLKRDNLDFGAGRTALTKSASYMVLGPRVATSSTAISRAIRAGNARSRFGAGDLSTGLPAHRKHALRSTTCRAASGPRPDQPDRRGLRGWKRRDPCGAKPKEGRVRLIESVSKVRGIGAVKPLADAIRPERQIGSA